ncbi:MAG TPA: DUF11 domain-containing protein [Methylomirabilota bacterium]|nr:DUF11 domain-containing protein [Methylomirabilota bacterium]
MFGNLARALATSFLVVGLTVGGGQPAGAWLLPQADLSITKSGSPDPVAPGANLTYLIEVANAGPDAATAVTVTDTIPSGTTFVSLASPAGWTCLTIVGPITCTIPTLGVGATAYFTLVVNVTAGDGATITNTATVVSATTDLNQRNNTATATTRVKRQADLAVTKTDTPDPVVAGADLTYDITLKNLGPNDAENVSLTDATPANTTFRSFSQTSGPGFSCSAPAVGGTGTVSCTIYTFVAGATATFRLVVRVSPNTPDRTTLSNTATATSDTFDPCPGNNSATATTGVVTRADLSVTKSGAPDPVNAGGNITYTINVANAGPSDAQNASLGDATPTNTTFVSITQTAGLSFSCTSPALGGTGTVTCTIATFAAGASASFSLVVNVNANTPDRTTISNTATISSSTTDDVPRNNSATATTRVNAAGADLSVVKTGPTEQGAGFDISYTITVTNSGPSAASSVMLSDPTPTDTTFVSFTQNPGPTFTCSTPSVGGTGTVNCSVASLASGATATFTLVVNVNANVVEGTKITNTASVSSTTSDPDPTNNSSQVTTLIVGGNPT